MSVGSTETGWEMGMSFRGFASVVSVILDEAFLLLQGYNSIQLFSNSGSERD